MESIEAIRVSFDAAQEIADKVLAHKQIVDLMARLSSSYSSVGGRDVVMGELDGNMQKIASLLSQAPGWEEALDAIMLESEMLLLNSQLQSDVGEWTSAAESLESAILIAQKLGDEFAHAKALRQWGLMSLMQQQPARAEELFKRSARLFRRYLGVGMRIRLDTTLTCVWIDVDVFLMLCGLLMPFPVRVNANKKATPSSYWLNFMKTAVTASITVCSTISRLWMQLVRARKMPNLAMLPL